MLKGVGGRRRISTLVTRTAASRSITLSVFAVCSHCINSHRDLSSLDLMRRLMLI